jgi:Ca2+/Na+ antiporter
MYLSLSYIYAFVIMMYLRICHNHVYVYLALSGIYVFVIMMYISINSSQEECDQPKRHKVINTRCKTIATLELAASLRLTTYKY